MKIIGRWVYRLGLPQIRRLLTGTRRVRVLTEAEGEILLVKNWISRQWWTLPGGGMKIDESPASTAQRELLEELALNAKATDFKLITNFEYEEDGVIWQAFILYLPLNVKPKLKPRRWELTDLAWFKPEQLPENRSLVVERALDSKHK